jgi:itaconyl-CoA hydratase
LWAESEVLGVRESRTRPSCGIVRIRTRGLNQRHEVVIEFTRSFMIFKRTAPEVEAVFPATDAPWTVGGETA